MLALFKTLGCAWTQPVHLIHMPMDASTSFKFPSAHPKAELVHKHFFKNGFESFCKYRDRVAFNCDSLVGVQVTKVPIVLV